MAQKLTYFMVFLITFIGVTGTVYYLNQKYTNIFTGDFTPAPNPKVVNMELSSKVDSLNTYFRITKIDTFYIYQDTTLIRRLSNAQEEIQKLKNEISNLDKIISEKDAAILKQTETAVAEDNSTREEWLTSTVKLYETMDARRAAALIEKIIETTSVDLAKEIIYKMKRKKAGEILSQLSPEKATIITGAN